MKKYLKLISFVLALLLLLCGCQKVEDKNSETTGKITEKNTDKAEETTVTEPDTSAVTTASDTTVTTPNDGKIHVTSISLDKYEVSLTVGSNDMPMVTMSPSNAADLSEIWECDNTSVATVNKYGKITGVSEGSCTVTVTSADNKSVKASVKVTVKANSAAGTKVEGATYIKGILVVNKTYSLPSNYNPGVDATAQSALNAMIAAAANDGITLWVASGFRSYERQNRLYSNYVARDGKAEADRYSARAGHSEHQTGLAFDLNSLDQSFGDTPEGKWIAANCWKYGFILRYPKEKEAQTGYMYEPWHVRYLGNENAKNVYNSGLCLEEYLGITSVYSN